MGAFDRRTVAFDPCTGSFDSRTTAFDSRTVVLDSCTVGLACCTLAFAYCMLTFDSCTKLFDSRTAVLDSCMAILTSRTLVLASRTAVLDLCAVVLACCVVGLAWCMAALEACTTALAFCTTLLDACAAMVDCCAVMFDFGATVLACCAGGPARFAESRDPGRRDSSRHDELGGRRAPWRRGTSRGDTGAEDDGAGGAAAEDRRRYVNLERPRRVRGWLQVIEACSKIHSQTRTTTAMTPRPPMIKVFNAGQPVTEKDVRELKDFLHSDATGDEIALHNLLERHPSLIGVLGFSEFASEQPLFKRDENNKVVLQDARKRDRSDLIAAKTSTIRSPFAKGSYKSTHIIELKSASTKISERGHGTRLSPEANHAVGQLRDYKQWLTTIPENRSMFDTLGWDIRIPMQYLVMGTASEFLDNPGHLEELRGRLQEIGVCLVTVDEILQLADRHAQEHRRIIDIVNWTTVPGSTQDIHSRILVQVESFALIYPTSVRFRRSTEPPLPPDLEFVQLTWSTKQRLLLQLRQDFFGLCAYCRTPDSVAGGMAAYGIEHFHPRSQFPELDLWWSNLLYTCRTCNTIKAATWPTDSEERSGYHFVDPMDDFEVHFEEMDDEHWKPKTRPAEYSISKLKLNRESLLMMRRLLRSLKPRR